MFNGGMTMGPSLADIAAITNRQNDDGNGFNNGWWILISQLRPSANPAYIVDNPFRSTGNLPCQQPTCCNG